MRSAAARPSAHGERSRASRLFDALDEDLDLAAAGEAYVPGLLVGDAEIEEARLAVAMDLSASPMTAPSTQPPDTEPRKLLS